MSFINAPFASSLAVPATLCVVLLACSCADKPKVAMQMPAPTVSVALVIQRDESDWDEESGRLEPVEQVDIHSHVAGFITRVAFADGALVHRGDALFDIDPRPYKVQEQKAQAELGIVRARLAQARTEAERAKALLSIHGITQELADQRLSVVISDEAGVHSAEASLAAAQLDLSYSHLTAPISGLVSKAALTVGNYVEVGTSTLANLVSVDPVYVTFDLDERTFLAARSVIDAPTPGKRLFLGIATEGEDGYPHQAQISFLDNRIDSQSGTMRLRALLPNHDGHLVVGSFARIHIPLCRPKATLLVDERAVGIDQGQHFLYLLDHGNTIAYRPVTLGAAVGHLRTVQSGIAVGDTVVVNGLQRIHPGMTVTPETVEMGARDGNKVASAESKGTP